jgi:hypothetical protein
MKLIQCPECGENTLRFNAVRRVAECRRFICDFEKDVENKIDFKRRFARKK